MLAIRWFVGFAEVSNDNGDILVRYRNADGSLSLFNYNPNNDAGPVFLTTADYGYLNNPVGSRSAQVGGALADGSFGTPYRWTPSQSALQTFSPLSNPGIFGMNDSGMLCGRVDVTTTSGSGPNKTTTTKYYPMRLSSLPANILTSAPANSYARRINSTADLLIVTSSVSAPGIIYRDDWGAYGYYLDINKLAVGTSGDLAVWNGTGAYKYGLFMNDRGSSSNAGQIGGTILLTANGPSLNFVLNLVPAP